MRDVIPGSWCLLDLHSIRCLDWIHLPCAPIHPDKPLLEPSVGDRPGPLSETRCDEQSKYALARWFLRHPWLNIMWCIYFYPSPPLWINVFNLPVTELCGIFMWEEHSSRIASQKFAFFLTFQADLSTKSFFVQPKLYILRREDVDLMLGSGELRLNHKVKWCRLFCWLHKLDDLIKALIWQAISSFVA